MAQEQECPKCKPGTPGWVVTFGDMMSLLLTFFIMLLSFANMDMVKYKEVLGSVEKAFGVQTQVYQLGKPGGLQQPIKLETAQNDTESRKDILVQLLQSKTYEENLQNNIFIVKDKMGVRMDIAGSVMFEAGQTTLLPAAVRLFQKIIPILQETLYKVSVEGHTDTTALTGNPVFPSNWELSSARAGTVVRFFITEGQLDPRRFSAVGRADTQPLVDNDTPENRAANRRVSVIFLVF
jgi:chemotaxis protein MotB